MVAVVEAVVAATAVAVVEAAAVVMGAVAAGVIDGSIPPHGQGASQRGFLIDLPPSLLTGSSSRTQIRTDPLRTHCQFVDPECLVVPHAVMEVRQHHELVELHLGKVGRAEHHVRSLDDGLPINPTPKFPVVIGAIVRRVQAVELEHRLDPVLLAVIEQDILAVEELPIVPTPQRSSVKPWGVSRFWMSCAASRSLPLTDSM